MRLKSSGSRHDPPSQTGSYAIANSPFGPFERIGVVLKQDPSVATGAGHHSLIKVPKEDEWYIVYYRRPLDETETDPRVTSIDKLEFDENGHIKPVTITFEGVKKRSLK